MLPYHYAINTTYVPSGCNLQELRPESAESLSSKSALVTMFVLQESDCTDLSWNGRNLQDNFDKDFGATCLLTLFHILQHSNMKSSWMLHNPVYLRHWL